jgi:hypothetical protein
MRGSTARWTTPFCYPWHDTLCQAEGAAMLDLLAGDASGKEALQAWKGRVPKYREACYRNAVNP